MTQKVREGGRVVNVSAVIATAVNIEGRETIGFDIVTTEDTAGWTAFLRSLVARACPGSSWSSPSIETHLRRLTAKHAEEGFS